MPKFKIGDKVYVRRDVETGVPKAYIDHDRIYTIVRTWGNGSFVLDDVELSCFGFTENWLLPAKFEVRVKEGRIKDVKFSGPATIVFWTDGTKTVVKCRKGDEFDPEKGIAMACAKKLLGNEDGYHKTLATHYKKKRVWEEEMDTKQIRSAVSRGCLLNPGCDSCPCCPGKGGTCYIIEMADRGELITMLKEFEKADKWSYEDWRMSHA